MMGDTKQEISSREKARKASRELLKQRNDTSGGGRVGSTQCSKIGKKCNFKSTKTHFLPFQKWQKINFCARKFF